MAHNQDEPGVHVQTLGSFTYHVQEDDLSRMRTVPMTNSDMPTVPLPAHAMPTEPQALWHGYASEEELATLGFSAAQTLPINNYGAAQPERLIRFKNWLAGHTLGKQLLELMMAADDRTRAAQLGRELTAMEIKAGLLPDLEVVEPDAPSAMGAQPLAPETIALQRALWAQYQAGQQPNEGEA